MCRTHYDGTNPRKMHQDDYAPRLLLSAVVGEKLFPKSKYVFTFEPLTVNGAIDFSLPSKNIVAFQITPDTRKYISNVFYALGLQWKLYPRDYIKPVRRLIETHYSADNLEIFDEAYSLWSVGYYTEGRTGSLPYIKRAIQSKIADNMVFYGAGANMERVLNLFELCGIPFNYPIWDKDTVAGVGKTVLGHKAVTPDFETKVTDAKAVITIDNKEEAFYVAVCLRRLGYDVIGSKLDFLDLYE
jgi:hypothetical protein